MKLSYEVQLWWWNWFEVTESRGERLTPMGHHRQASSHHPCPHRSGHNQSCSKDPSVCSHSWNPSFLGIHNSLPWHTHAALIDNHHNPNLNIYMHAKTWCHFPLNIISTGGLFLENELLYVKKIVFIYQWWRSWTLCLKNQRARGNSYTSSSPLCADKVLHPCLLSQSLH